MKQILIIAFTLFVTVCMAQDNQQQVTDAVTDYVDAFYYGDTAKILRSISPAVVKYGYYRKQEQTTYAGEAMSFRQMLDYATAVGKRKNTGADKRVKKIEILDCQDQTASAKLTAWWGTDYILLARSEGKWLITHVLWQSPPLSKNN